MNSLYAVEFPGCVVRDRLEVRYELVTLHNDTVSASSLYSSSVFKENHTCKTYLKEIYVRHVSHFRINNCSNKF